MEKPQKSLALTLAIVILINIFAITTVAETATVVLAKNGGAGGDDSITVEIGGQLPAKIEPPVSSGKIFAGYYNTPYGGLRYYNTKGERVFDDVWQKGLKRQNGFQKRSAFFVKF